MLNKNSKIAKSTGFYKFSLPAVKTCPMANTCKKVCYACKGFYTVFPSVKESHLSNYKESLKKTFTIDLIVKIHRMRSLKAVRIHDSGDFYSQEYLDKWVDIAEKCPDITFYCYTKSLHLNWNKFDRLKNTKRIQSEGGKLDSKIDYSKPHARIFKSLKELEKAGYVNCSKDDSIAALKNVIKIGLILH